MRRIIIDTDPGIDDAMAILFALKSPELRVEALTTVFGNGPIERMTPNALRILEVAGREDIPVAAGAGAPLLRPYRGRGQMVHGRDGLGETNLPPPRGRPSEMRAVELLISRILEAPEEITLVALGPLTNLDLAVRVAPAIAQAVREVILMGGAATVRGNASPAAEANIHNDPEAAWIVFHAGWPVTMVGLDVTMKTIMTPEYLEGIRQAHTPVTDFIAAITPHYLNYNRQRGLPGFAVHDPSAILYAIDPGFFRTERVYVDVQTGDGPASGATVADFRGQWEREPNVNVCLDVDSQRFLEFYRERITRP